MKSTTLAQLLALPAVIATFAGELTIVVRDDLYHVEVAGKVDPDRQMTWMDSENSGIDQTEVKCLGTDDQVWTHWGCGQENRVGYRQVGIFNFAEVTKDPRPFIISSAQDKTPVVYQLCNITVSGAGKDVWDVVGGFVGPQSGATEVHCENNLTDIEYAWKLENGTEWEKKIGAELKDSLVPEYDQLRTSSVAVASTTAA